ncbi:MAG: hypothetical protein HY207_11230 [Nitrospirae bacterium]|nr:hypothetical protein [Nitrospirota bacterium]
MDASCTDISLSQPAARVAAPTLTEDAALSCCQRSVRDALDSNSSMGIIVSLALLAMGFVMGVVAAVVAVQIT